MDSQFEDRESSLENEEEEYLEDEDEFPMEYKHGKEARGEYVNDDEIAAGSNSHGLNLKYAMGFNYKLINGAINLTRTDDQARGNTGKPITEIFYVVGHTGVIYNYVSKNQRLLQGHCNAITSVAYSHQKGVLITADEGPESLLVVWDVKSGTPRKCIFDPHPNGVECLDVSEDGETIITLSREDPDPVTKKYASQSIRVWKWELEEEQCTNSGVLLPEPPNDSICYQKFIQFNYKKPNEFATTGREKVFFWKMEHDEGVCTYYSPQTNNDYSGGKKRDGSGDRGGSKRFTQTVFIPDSTQAVSGTEEGSLVVWDISLIMEEMSQPDQKREIKTIKLMNDNKINDSGEVGISVLKASEVLLIVGATNGNVRFYDYHYRIVGWFEDKADLAEITSISLSNVHFHYVQVLEKLEKNEHDFDYPDFIVVDKKAKIVLMKAEEFKGVTDDDKQGEVLIQSIPSEVKSICARPDQAMLGIACSDGNVYEWSWVNKDPILKSLRNFKKQKNPEEPSCLKYSPDGKYLVVASNNRNVYVCATKNNIWQTSPIQISHKKEYVHGEDIQFAADSKSFIIRDSHSCVSLFKIDVDVNNPSESDWVFYAKLKSHFSEINGICFGEYIDAENNSNELRNKFFSIGEDKFMFQYDLESCTKLNLDVFSYSKLEKEAVPTACIWYPVNYLKEQVLMTASDDFKIKLWEVSNKKPICRETFLGPVYGDPINKFIYLNVYGREDQNVPKYVAYTTAKKIVGIIKLPLDGNPNKFMGMIAHPGGISSATSTSDGKYLFTSGADEVGTINIWRVNYSVLEEQDINKEVQQNPLDTYPNLLEGGKEGQTYRDLKDFFYYAQISSNTENPTKAKKLDGKIPSKIVQNLMRALGYYPTRAEIENMQHEVIFSKWLESNKHTESLELQTFVRMFLNHRPVYGLTMDMIKSKMSILSKYIFKRQDQGQKETDNTKKSEAEKRAEKEAKDRAKGLAIEKGEMSRGDFIYFLKSFGEKMDDEEVNASLKNLLGDPKDLPEMMSSQYIIEDLLGFEIDEEALAEQDNELEEDDEFSQDGISVHHY